MRLINALGLSLLSLASGSSADSKGCDALKSCLGDSVFFPLDKVYSHESQNFWSNTEILSPACVFRPDSAQQLGEGIKLLTERQANVAVRGGGHMGIKVASYNHPYILLT